MPSPQDLFHIASGDMGFTGQAPVRTQTGSLLSGPLSELHSDRSASELWQATHAVNREEWWIDMGGGVDSAGRSSDGNPQR